MFIFNCVCVYGLVYISVRVHGLPMSVISSGLIGACELPTVDAGNQTPVLGEQLVLLTSEPSLLRW